MMSLLSLALFLFQHLIPFLNSLRIIVTVLYSFKLVICKENIYVNCLNHYLLFCLFCFQGSADL